MLNRVSPQMTIGNAAQQMGGGDFGMMPVAEDDRMIRTFSDRDIAIRGIGEGLGAYAKAIQPSILTFFSTTTRLQEFAGDTRRSTMIKRLSSIAAASLFAATLAMPASAQYSSGSWGFRLLGFKLRRSLCQRLCGPQQL